MNARGARLARASGPSTLVHDSGTGEVIQRDRVLRVLDASRAQGLVCVQAPGGYGKTTVLRQWVATDSRPVVWVSVRPQAPDPGWLVEELSRQMQKAGVLASPIAVSPVSDLMDWHLGRLPAVESAVASAPPFVLVIDDAGSMSGAAWSCLVASVVDALPVGGQLVLATRDALPTSVARLRSRGAVRVVGIDELALDIVEGEQLARLLGAPISADACLEVLERTQGWPVAVHLALSAAAAGRPTPATAASAVTSTQLDDYLRAEILERLGPPDASFLLRVSILDQLDEPTCDAVSGDSGSLGRLRRLADSQHLLTQVDCAGGSFRMHPLLADFLGRELEATDRAAWRAAHAAASTARQHLGDRDGAVFHARLSGDDTRLGRLVWGYAGMVIGQGHASVVHRWLDGLDDARLAAQGELALTVAWLAALSGDHARMVRFEAATEAAVQRGATHLIPDVQLLRATVDADSIDHMTELARSAVEAKDPDDPWLTVALFVVGVSRVIAGDDVDGEAALRRADLLATAHELPAMRSRCLAALAECALAAGNQPRALALIREARELVVRFQLEQVVSTAPVFVTSAYGYVLEGRLVDARREATLALRLTSLMRIASPWNLAYGRLGLARVFLALGDRDQVEHLVAEAEAAYGPALRSARADELFGELRGRLAHLSPSEASIEPLTLAELRVLQYLPTHLSFPQIADELFVSRHTVKTQAMSAYRKLGAHTRDEAIHRARDAGLLQRR